MTDHSIVQPRITVLTEEQIAQIHAYALEILTSTGVRVDSRRAQELFRRRLGPAVVRNDRVYIPRQAVEWAIAAAPAMIDIYDRRGKLAFHLGNDRARFGIGVTTLFYQDPLNEELTPFNRQHMQLMVRLGERLPNFDVISTVGIVQDVPPEVSDLYGTLDMVANTTKPLVLLVSEESGFASVLDLLEALTGDLTAKPFVIPYFNPVTPLVLNEGTVDKLFIAIQRGLPVIFSNYSMAGTSTPITPAGTLVVLLAELLAGLTLSQLIKEGAPVILGILPAYFDMKTMVNFYDPQSMLLNLACAEMMEHYAIPHCGTSGSGTGWGPDLLAADTYWMNHLSACLTKGGLCPFVGDTLTSKAFSPVNLVYVHEVIEQARRFAGGFKLDDATAGLEDIQAVGPGGNFLTVKTTRNLYRTAYYNSPIFPRFSMEKWDAEGRPLAIDILRKYTLDLLGDLKAPDDYGDLIQQGEALIEKMQARPV